MYKNNKALLSAVAWLGTALFSTLFSLVVKAQPVDKLIKTLMKEHQNTSLQLTKSTVRRTQYSDSQEHNNQR